MTAHPGGFESECWIADDTWFIKLWRDPGQPSGLPLLTELAARGLPVSAPVPTISGALSASWQGRPYAVFPYVPGRAQSEDDWPLVAAALKQVHGLRGIDLPYATMDEPDIQKLREHTDHPWIRDRSQEVQGDIDRLEGAIARARAADVPIVVAHLDFGGANVLIEDGRVAAILDWDQAVLGPREHDVWIAAERKHGAEFLAAYGARDLNLDHIEYALLARALRDMAARVLSERDRPGVDTWGFDRIARLESDLEMFRPFCR